MATKRMEGIAPTLEEMALRYTRLTVEVRRHSAEMADVRKERRALGATLLPLLAEAGYIGERQLLLDGFDSYESFGLSVTRDEKPIMIESGDTEPRELLHWQAKKWRKPRRR